ncbi:MAG TPA: hypothetical protein VFB42_06135 [Gaiellaceae bacterium]|nr:hypothetical protein [Gaiellaceae bacterium]
MGPDEGAVAVRAFRGSRRASVYREHVLAAEAFARILATGRRAGLALLPSLDRRGRRELDKREAARLAAELTTVRASGELLDLDADLTAVAEVARWCAHAPRGSWLRVERP